MLISKELFHRNFFRMISEVIVCDKILNKIYWESLAASLPYS